MIFSVFQKNLVFRYSWSTLLWYRCYYPHRSRDALSPVCGIFIITNHNALLNTFDFITFKKIAWGGDRIGTDEQTSRLLDQRGPRAGSMEMLHTQESLCPQNTTITVLWTRRKKFRIRETKHLLTDADSSTDTTVGWTKNTQTQFFWKTEKNIQNAKTQKRLEICQN